MQKPKAREARGTRPGGRTARNRDAVFRAVRELMAEQATQQVAIADVAARSGVHQTTIYRRWKTPAALALDVAMAGLSQRSPMPDTGTLRGDLLAFATRIAASIIRPDGLAFLRTVVAASGDVELLRGRRDEIQAMLDRAPKQHLRSDDVFDGLLAPIYLRVLFGFGPPKPPRLAALVERLVAAGDR